MWKLRTINFISNMNATYCNRLQCGYKGHNRKGKATCTATGCNVRIKFLTGCPMRDEGWYVMDEVDYAEHKREKSRLNGSNSEIV